MITGGSVTLALPGLLHSVYQDIDILGGRVCQECEIDLLLCNLYRCKVFINPPVVVRPGGVNHNTFIVVVRPGGANHNDKCIMISPPLLWLTPPICDGLSVLRY